MLELRYVSPHGRERVLHTVWVRKLALDANSFLTIERRLQALAALAWKPEVAAGTSPWDDGGDSTVVWPPEIPTPPPRARRGTCSSCFA